MSVTGNLRTLRGQSSTAGSRTIGSILANGNSIGSLLRVYNFYKRNYSVQQFYNDVIFKMRK